MTITFKCTECGKINTVEVEDTLNLTSNQDLLKSILDNSKFQFKCSECGKEHNVIYDVLLQDDNEKFYIKINSGEELMTLVSQDDYKIRIVKDLNQANEKLRCFYYRLDDRLVELVKFLIKDDLEKNNDNLKITEMYFFRFSSNDLEFLIFTEDEFLGTMKYSFNGYKELKYKHGEKLIDEIQVVDEKYALSILNAQSNEETIA